MSVDERGMRPVWYPASENGPQTVEPLPPIPPEVPSAGWLKRKLSRENLGRLTAGTVLALPSIAAGTATSAALLVNHPVEITPAPGVTATAGIQTANFSTLTYGFTAGLSGPEGSKNILGQDFGAKIQITNIDLPGSEKSLKDAAAALVDSLNPAELKQSVGDAILFRQIGGSLGIGTGVFTGLEIARRIWQRRQREREENRDNEELEQLESSLALTNQISGLAADREKLSQLKLDLDNRKSSLEARDHPAKPEKAKLLTRRRLGAIALSLAAIGGALSYVHAGLQPEPSQKEYVAQAADGIPQLENFINNHSLQNAFVENTPGVVVRGLVGGLRSEIRHYDAGWRSYANYLTNVAIPKFRAEGGMDYMNNPDISAYFVVTDIHDNHATESSFLNPVIKQFGVSYVLDLGDNENSSGKSWFDDGAWGRVAQIVKGLTTPDGQPLQIILAPGNHDEPYPTDAINMTLTAKNGQVYHPFIVLDKDTGYTFNGNGVTFVGSADLNRTTSGTVPSNEMDQIANDIKQGQVLSKAACQIYGQTGEKPIVLAHEFPALLQSSPCAILLLDGHTHVNYWHIFRNPDGSLTPQLTTGSASGDGPNNMSAWLNLPTRLATTRVILYNNKTHSLLPYFIQIDVPPNGEPSVRRVDYPSASQAQTLIADNSHVFNMGRYPTVSQVLKSDDPAFYNQLVQEYASDQTDHQRLIAENRNQSSSNQADKPHTLKSNPVSPGSR